MRINRTAQPSVFQPDEIVHPRGMERASEWLDEHPELRFGACAAGSPSCGRRGLTCDPCAVRCSSI